jgi:hypothetical protein
VPIEGPNEHGDSEVLPLDLGDSPSGGGDVDVSGFSPNEPIVVRVSLAIGGRLITVPFSSSRKASFATSEPVPFKTWDAI